MRVFTLNKGRRPQLEKIAEIPMVNSFVALDNKEEEQVEKHPKKAHDSSCKSWVESSFGKQKSPAPKDTITYDGEDAENSGQHVLQVENENQTKNWTLVAHKKSTSSRSLSPTSQNNSPCSEKGSTENFHNSEKRQDTSNASRDLLCSNSFDALLKTTGKQVRLTENDHDLIQEKQVSPPALNSKLSPEAPVFVPKCVLARKNESNALVSNTIDLGEDSLDEDGVDLG
ncbi:hypothetical protein H5410_027909 [Solanum commersonii]|uniref:NB-ARC domain containing protein n=1 Tax=Solanum commersonii TaxID=4109 RepID=A0A9J5Z0H7_SOLCO|nr:hypothetical protein H5410_027909 [Solanum commersonii]